MAERGKICTVCFGVHLEAPFFLSIDYFMPSFLHFIAGLEEGFSHWGFGPVKLSLTGVLGENMVFALPIRAWENNIRFVEWK